MQEYKGSLDASGKRYAVVASRFNEAYTTRLVEGAVDGLLRLGADEDDVEIFWVPGSFELGGTAMACARSGRYDGIVVLGVLIRGATAHFDLIAGQAASGVAAVFRETGVPATFGVVTADTLEQAAERCGAKHGNRGWDAAQAVVEMANLGDAFEGGWPAAGEQAHGHEHAPGCEHEHEDEDDQGHGHHHHEHVAERDGGAEGGTKRTTARTRGGQ